MPEWKPLWDPKVVTDVTPQPKLVDFAYSEKILKVLAEEAIAVR